jgi:hypothetical protein
MLITASTFAASGLPSALPQPVNTKELANKAVVTAVASNERVFIIYP